MSAHSASHRRGWVSALVAQVADFVFEEVEETVEQQPVELEPHPVIAVVSAAPRSGATTVARLLAAQLAIRAEGSAVVVTSAGGRRSRVPPARAASRLATALAGVGCVHTCGRLALLAADPATAVAAGRYLAPVVLDVAADGSAATLGALADRIAVVAPATAEPALLDAVATLPGRDALKVVNRAREEAGRWTGRADVLIPDSRMGARAAAVGTRAPGPLGAAVAEVADALEGSE